MPENESSTGVSVCVAYARCRKSSGRHERNNITWVYRVTGLNRLGANVVDVVNLNMKAAKC